MVPRRTFVKRFQQIARRRRGCKSYNGSKFKRTAHKHDGTKWNFNFKIITVGQNLDCSLIVVDPLLSFMVTPMIRVSCFNILNVCSPLRIFDILLATPASNLFLFNCVFVPMIS